MGERIRKRMSEREKQREWRDGRKTSVTEKRCLNKMRDRQRLTDGDRFK